MKNEKQKLIIEHLLSSPELLVKCLPIIKSTYFDPEFRPVITDILSYYKKYSASLPLSVVNSDYSLGLTQQEITPDINNYLSEEIEKFCKDQAIRESIESSIEDIKNQKYDILLRKIHDAVSISLEVNLGIDLYENIEENLRKASERLKPIPCGIKELDDKLGGFARKEMTIFSSNTGGGKSITLANLAVNYSTFGYHVLYISLELSEEMVNMRNAVILSSTNVKKWRESIPEISAKVNTIKDFGAGSLVVTRMPVSTTVLALNSYIKQYQTKYKRPPDVLIIDYYDLLSTHAPSYMNSSDVDKLKSREVYELGNMYNCILLTATQQNRSGLKTPSEHNQSIIGGNISKLDIVDNSISVFMDANMRMQGQIMFTYLKTRSSSVVGTTSNLAFNTETLQISDLGHKPVYELSLKDLMKYKAKTKTESIDQNIDFINKLEHSLSDESLPVDSSDTNPKLNLTNNDYNDNMDYDNDAIEEDISRLVSVLGETSL